MSTPGSQRDELARLFSGDGEMAGRMRALDWAATPLGSPKTWPQALRSAVVSLLVSKAQIVFVWGDDLITFYNDAYRPVLGVKHPDALGKPVRDVWSEIWLSGLKDLFDGVLDTGDAYWAQDRPFFIERHGYLEETYFDVSYDPVRDESDRVRGVYCIVTETTGRVLGERRLTTLRDLGRITQQASGVAEVHRAAANVLRESADIPFALLYGNAAPGAPAQLLGWCGLDATSPAAPSEMGGSVRPSWPLMDDMTILDEPSLRPFGPLHVGPWPEPIQQVAVVPLALPGQAPEGCLVAGINVRRRIDDDYRDFLRLVAANIAGAVAAVRRTEEERQRAEMLAELDRAKTAFFSNVSHEFRTPLTLMLGPLEDALASGLSEGLRSRLEVSHRNGLRLLRLVNTLLDFSRIEAGRAEAVFESIDIADLTRELASVFRSAIERAGLSFGVVCDRPRSPVFVDRDMWEKIVLNLLSNAFKFTFEGGISVSLAERDDAVVLSVEDTGVGIPQDELPHVFERFHRVRGTEGRTHEGTGIGLALVSDLVKLHGGAVEVDSRLGQGSRFSVRIPTGSNHLPQDRVGARRARASTALGAAPFVEEAVRWLPETGEQPTGEDEGSAASDGAHVTTQGARVLVADDNADMRAYLVRLLRPHWTVEAVADGEEALQAARRQRPDLILSDVMMPRRDGMALIGAIRGDPALASIPVILLSARAGAEARVEGMNAGADDYLTKPFAARELVARVNANVTLAHVRREALRELRESEERFRAIVTASGDVVYRMGPDWTEMRFLEGRQFIADMQEPSRSWLDKYIHPDDQAYVTAAIEQAIRTKSILELEHRVLRVDGTLGWILSRAIPVFDEAGEIIEWLGTATDLTDRKRGETLREELLRIAEASRAEAEDANRAKDEFLATVSHELRSPLQGILGWLSLLKQQRLDPAQTTRALESVERSVRLQAQLVHDLMDVSRIVAGKVELERGPLDLASVVESTAEEFMPGAVSKGIALEVVGGHCGIVMGDRERLHQVIANLVSNALKFTPSGGRVTLTCARDNGHCVVTVTDTGQGIEQGFVTRLFERFTQADTSSTRRHGGLGLGLAIVKHLVELHGGTVAAESDGPGRGASFQVRLPEESRSARVPLLPTPGTQLPAIRLDGVEILLVEDDQDSLEVMTLALQATGAIVRPAGSVGEAWSAFAERAPDVVVSDLSMPEEDGYALLRRMKASGANGSVPAIALTGFTASEDRARALSAGFVAHVPKPVEPEVLVEVLSGVLTRNRAGGEHLH